MAAAHFESSFVSASHSQQFMLGQGKLPYLPRPSAAAAKPQLTIAPAWLPAQPSEAYKFKYPSNLKPIMTH